jgi:hypothetical protein
MENESDTDLVPVANTRQMTIDALCEHFANDIMSTVRHPGETARDAWGRRKLEHNECRRLMKGG